MTNCSSKIGSWWSVSGSSSGTPTIATSSSPFSSISIICGAPASITCTSTSGCAALEADQQVGDQLRADRAHRADRQRRLLELLDRLGLLARGAAVCSSTVCR